MSATATGSARISSRALAQRFGGEDEIVDRHDTGGEFAVQPAEIAVAGEDDVVGGDLAFAGAHPGFGPGDDFEDFGSFVQDGPGRGGGLGEAEGEVQRVDVAGVAVDLAALEGV